MESKQQGDVAEQIALDHLLSAGLTLVERNYRSRFGEIDLIMSKSSQLIFVEVRYRKSASYGSALESVNSAKQQRIIKTTQVYIQKTKHNYQNYRFDVVAISLKNSQNEIVWLENAFQLN